MSSGNGQGGPRPVDDRDVRIAQLENRIYELLDQVEALANVVREREAEIRVIRDANAALGRAAGEAEAMLRGLVDYGRTAIRKDNIIPEHLAHYIEQAAKLVKARDSR